MGWSHDIVYHYHGNGTKRVKRPSKWFKIIVFNSAGQLGQQEWWKDPRKHKWLTSSPFSIGLLACKSMYISLCTPCLCPPGSHGSRQCNSPYRRTNPVHKNTVWKCTLARYTVTVYTSDQLLAPNSLYFRKERVNCAKYRCKAFLEGKYILKCAKNCTKNDRISQICLHFDGRYHLTGLRTRLNSVMHLCTFYVHTFFQIKKVYVIHFNAHLARLYYNALATFC